MPPERTFPRWTGFDPVADLGYSSRTRQGKTFLRVTRGSGGVALVWGAAGASNRLPAVLRCIPGARHPRIPVRKRTSSLIPHSIAGVIE